MRTRVLAGVGGIALVATLLVPALPAAAEIAPPTLPITRPESTLIQWPSQYPTQNTLTVFPDLPTDVSIFRGVIPYDEIAPKLNEWQSESNLISAQVVGKSDFRSTEIPDGRDIYLVTLTAPETPEETAEQVAWRDKIKYDPAAALLDDELQAGYKVPIWFNGNIHGNEWEGTDATLNYIEELLASTDPAVTELLATSRLYFTVTNNPDGRAAGQREQALGYDPNRDAVTGATSEASILRDLSALIQPTYFVDLHGYTGVLQVEPCGPPHGENYEYDLFLPHAYAAALAVEEAVVDAAIPGNPLFNGGINIPYRDQREGWDDWPPIFAPQYVAYQGAITNTVELPLGRITPVNAANQTNNSARSVTNIEVADVVIKTIVDYVSDHTAALLDNQMEIFRRGLAGEPSVEIPADIAPEDLEPGVPTEWTTIWDETDIYVADYPRAYVLPMGGTQRSDTDTERLVESLLVHGIKVKQATDPFTAGGSGYEAGSYIVDMHQPLRGLANVLLDEGTDISARIGNMYDVSAWSLALLWGADVHSVDSTEDELFAFDGVEIDDVDPSGTVPAPGTYLTFEPRGAAEWQAVNELLEEGIVLEQLEDQSIILGPDATSYAAALEVADIFGVNFEGSDGQVLRDGTSKPLKSLKIGYTGQNIDRDMLTKLGFKNFVTVSGATINNGTVDLSTIDLLWIGSNLTGLDATGIGYVNTYLAASKPVLGRGTAIATFVNARGILAVTSASASSSSNAVVDLQVQEGGVMSQWPQDTAFVYPAVRYSGLGANAFVESKYAATAEDIVISGWWPASNRTAFVDQPAAVSAVGPTGSKTYLFGTSLIFRNHPTGSFSEIGRAMFWGATPGATSLPVPPTDRISGANRYEGAVNISKEAFPTTAPVVYVTTGTNYPDALSAGPAAAFEGGPVLLVPGSSVPASVSAEIARLDPARIVVVGGEASVTPDAYAVLSGLADSIERIGGANRYEVSRNIATDVFGTAERAYLATGANFPDALAAGAVAGAMGAPVVLVQGSQPEMDAATETVLDGLGVTSLRVAGGPVSVSAGILADANVIAPTVRLDGADRYAAARAINADAYTEADRVFLATGLNFPDALAGSVLAALNDAPLYVVKTNCVDQETLDAIAGLGATHITLLGGEASLGAGVASLTPCV